LKEAITEFGEAVRLAPDAESHYYLAVALALDGNTPEAERHLEAARKIDPGFAPARAALQQPGAAAR